ncbi:hypothetical protein [Flagellimonas marinaquae]
MQWVYSSIVVEKFSLRLHPLGNVRVDLEKNNCNSSNRIFHSINGHEYTTKTRSAAWRKYSSCQVSPSELRDLQASASSLSNDPLSITAAASHSVSTATMHYAPAIDKSVNRAGKNFLTQSQTLTLSQVT